MSLITIQMYYKTSDWFIQCAEHLHDSFRCKPLPQDQYLRLNHISTLLNKDRIKTLNWIINHPKVHGFIVDEKLYVHPTAFTRLYMRKVLKAVDKSYHLEHPFIN